MNKFILLTLFPLFMFTQTYETQKYDLIDKYSPSRHIRWEHAYTSINHCISCNDARMYY